MEVLHIMYNDPVWTTIFLIVIFCGLAGIVDRIFSGRFEREDKHDEEWED